MFKKMNGDPDWPLIVVIGAVLLYLGFSYVSPQIAVSKMKSELRQERDETIFETASADAAQKQQAIKIVNSHWINESYLDDFNGSAEIFFRPNKEFVMRLSIKNGDTTLMDEPISGTYSVAGSTIIFDVKSGARGYFPKSGRVAVKKAAENILVLSIDDRDVTFVRGNKGGTIPG